MVIASTALFVGPGIDDLNESNDEPLADGDPGETVYSGDDWVVSSNAVEDVILQELNQERRFYGLEAVGESKTISSVARAHSAHMAELSELFHVTPDGTDPLDRYHQVSDDCALYGETLAKNWVGESVDYRDRDGNVTGTVVHRSAESVGEGIVRDWVTSEPHAATMFEEDQTRSWNLVGIGVVLTDDGAVYATANFCHES